MKFAQLALLAVAAGLAQARTFKLYNHCPFTVWGAHYTGNTANGVPLGPTGYQINAYATHNLYVPDSWQAARIWARTECDFRNPDTQACATGSCIGGLECKQPGVPPVTLAEFTLQQNGIDNYDVSNVDGSSVPMRIAAAGCPNAECPVDLNPGCPDRLRHKNRNGVTVGCKSACFAYGGDHNCCSGGLNTPDRCPASGVDYYSYFHDRCPNAYAYAYDDRQALKTCNRNADYTITFCP